MASVWSLHFHSLPFQPSIRGWKDRVSSDETPFLLHRSLSQQLSWIQLTTNRKFLLRAINDSVSSDVDQRAQNEVVDTAKQTLGVDSKDPLSTFQESIASFPPVVFLMKTCPGNNFAIGLCIAIAILVVAVRAYMARKSRQCRPGSVADLVRRGQLRSDRRGISRPLKYEDPFNNPFVKVGKSNSTVEMCGKLYRLAPVTLTNEQQAIHQKRRSRAYQWKRPTMFLKEGDSIPPDVDPDTVRWIPANHPFATTANDIDEDLAQNNVYQKHGVPFRIQAEHEALQRKLEALQNEEKLNNLFIDSRNAKDFQRPFKLNARPDELAEEGPINNHTVDTKPPKPERASNSIESNLSSEETQKP
ncbi:protein MULTIPLE CHLOROPLAST DIVISION SITE 1 isoform X1 [Herrania umbratica]|uniref:Protein MULTIPLE CHLOROPLAST DIVISION SITE 1 isoform X1 n=1 Tax=Herrania umbratica TaxID=108875 RepID=A0A6J1AB41_9ROSI|nr:protein MULTIPLE CHLOROPLAST DIVISION SITE 1 isoform X1 [Herrania umbratica]